MNADSLQNDDDNIINVDSNCQSGGASTVDNTRNATKDAAIEIDGGNSVWALDSVSDSHSGDALLTDNNANVAPIDTPMDDGTHNLTAEAAKEIQSERNAIGPVNSQYGEECSADNGTGIMLADTATEAVIDIDGSNGELACDSASHMNAGSQNDEKDCIGDAKVDFPADTSEGMPAEINEANGSHTFTNDATSYMASSSQLDGNFDSRESFDSGNVVIGNLVEANMFELTYIYSVS